MLQGASLQLVSSYTVYLAVACLITIPLGLYAFRRAFDFVRRQGTLSGY